MGPWFLTTSATHGYKPVSDFRLPRRRHKDATFRFYFGGLAALLSGLWPSGSLLAVAPPVASLLISSVNSKDKPDSHEHRCNYRPQNKPVDPKCRNATKRRE